jgi:hypothetical protein
MSPDTAGFLFFGFGLVRCLQGQAHWVLATSCGIALAGFGQEGRVGRDLSSRARANSNAVVATHTVPTEAVGAFVA